MKAIDFKSMLIGVLLCVVFMLTVGATDKGNEIGRYQAYGFEGGGNEIYNYLIDTTDGKLYQLHLRGVWDKLTTKEL